MITLVSKPWSGLTFSKSMDKLWKDLSTCWCVCLLASTKMISKLLLKLTILCPSAGSLMRHLHSSMLELQGLRLDPFPLISIHMDLLPMLNLYLSKCTSLWPLQLSSCFLVCMKEDSIEGIYDTLKECAVISKSAGGIGLSAHCIRATNSYICGTNGTSNGIIPMLRVFNDTARYVDQGGGKRKGEVCWLLH